MAAAAILEKVRIVGMMDGTVIHRAHPGVLQGLAKQEQFVSNQEQFVDKAQRVCDGQRHRTKHTPIGVER
jgi:microcompartment protein CcmL/EutN